MHLRIELKMFHVEHQPLTLSKKIKKGFNHVAYVSPI